MPEPLGRIDDMLAAIEMSETILGPAGRSLSAIEMLALERAIEIVSEASRKVAIEDFPALKNVLTLMKATLETRRDS